MNRAFAVILPVLTLLLGIALGRWWSDREHAADRGRQEAERSTERRLAAPPSSQVPPRADSATPAAPAAGVVASGHANGAAPGVIPNDGLPSVAHPVPAVVVPDTEGEQAVEPGARAETTDPGAGPAAAEDGSQEAAVAKMLAVLFTNPAFRDRMLDQMVAQVGQRVTFTDSQREAAKKELDAAMQPLVEVFKSGPVEMKDLDPKFQLVKEDWKRRLTPLLTAEQGLAFQSWLDEKHSLQVKMGMDEKGNPKDPDEHDDK